MQNHTAVPETDAAESGGRVAWLIWIDRFSTALALIAGVACVGLMIHVTLDVIGRATGNSIRGTIDIIQFGWMPLIISFGLAYALLVAMHIRVGLLTNASAPRAQRIVEVFAMTAIFATFGAFAWFSAERAVDGMALNEHASATDWLLVWPFRWVMVIGLATFALQALAELVRAITVPVFRASDDEDYGLEAVPDDLTLITAIDEPAVPGAGSRK